MKPWICALALLFASPAFAQGAGPVTPLFASEQPLRLTIRAPMSAVVSKRSDARHSATLAVTGTPEVHPITLSPRGITRRMSDICQFPPLRVDFDQPPPATSVFHGQRRLKLVTHCRQSADFQQKVLLEYAAYKLYNVLTPHSFRARLANIDYVDAGGRPFVSRVGFFIEEIDDVARRNGMVKPMTGDRVAVGQLEPRAAARFALFNYMIGNLDWSMRAGPVGEGCCHNGRLLAPSQSAAILTPVPYDFDYSGLVDAPYATPPEGISVRSVRERHYRGYCAHSADAAAVASEMVARRGEMLAALAAIPGLDQRSQRRAATYLDGFFSDVAAGKILRTCLG
jgi:hypothetical protein